MAHNDILKVRHKLTNLVESLPRLVVETLADVFDVLHDPASAEQPAPPAPPVAEAVPATEEAQ